VARCLLSSVSTKYIVHVVSTRAGVGGAFSCVCEFVCLSCCKRIASDISTKVCRDMVHGRHCSGGLTEIAVDIDGDEERRMDTA